VFHSTTEELLPNEKDLPFDVIPDPQKRLYREFGVETSWRSVLDPAAMATVPRGAALAVKRRFTGGRTLAATQSHQRPPWSTGGCPHYDRGKPGACEVRPPLRRLVVRR
jgi:hypothetical protein